MRSRSSGTTILAATDRGGNGNPPGGRRVACLPVCSEDGRLFSAPVSDRSPLEERDSGVGETVIEVRAGGVAAGWWDVVDRRGPGSCRRSAPEEVEALTSYVCIHGHFYQPPRENPWLEAIELQDSAYPYHDWNERVSAECYAQNAASRILDASNRIVRIANNFARISFDIGPTLLTWLADKAPEVHAAIVEADRASQERFSGHGSALAQPYNHLIMPLARPRDRRTQVAWAISDFVHRFGRHPEGMWLPEAAVDVDTLEVLAEHGIRFTVLAPHQARRVRAQGERTWQEVDERSLDTTVAYRVPLPSGRDIAVFFYDGAISRGVAFEGLLTDGGRFAGRLTGAAQPHRGRDELIHIATDGESYGHHHRHGDMALAFALQALESSPDVRLTNYGEYLERHPPVHEAQVVEASSWSCAHGVERWRSDCGCVDGGHPGWRQDWRRPVRDALDWLRDEVDPGFEQEAGRCLRDPWAARDDYVKLLLQRSPDVADRFLARHALRPLSAEERVRVWQLLELQRHGMLMYTSCGWFFDDLGRIETIQVLRYAGRLIQLARSCLGLDLEPAFRDRLEEAKSNDPTFGTGRDVYDTHVRSAVVDAHKLGAHYAVSSLFRPYRSHTNIYAYEVTRTAYIRKEVGDAALAAGRISVTSTITEESSELEFGVLHLGDHNIAGGVRPRGSDDAFHTVQADLVRAFSAADFPETLHQLHRHFGGERYSLRDLFRDEQRHILRTILDGSVAEARGAYRNIYRSRAPLMRYLTDLGARLPRVFQTAAEVVVNDELRQAFQDETLDPQRVRGLLEDARTWQLELDDEGLAHVLNATLERVTSRFWQQSLPPEGGPRRTGGDSGLGVFERTESLVELARSLPFEVDLWPAQRNFYAALQRLYPGLHARAGRGDATAAEWLDRFRVLGAALAVAVE